MADNPSVVYPDTTNNYKLDAVYHQANDKYACAVKMYLNDTSLYFDEAHTQEVPYEVALNFAEKGLIHVHDTDTFYPMTSYKDDSSTVTIGYGASKTVAVPSL